MRFLFLFSLLISSSVFGSSPIKQIPGIPANDNADTFDVNRDGRTDILTSSLSLRQVVVLFQEDEGFRYRIELLAEADSQRKARASLDCHVLK